MRVSHSRTFRWIFDRYLNFLIRRCFVRFQIEILDRSDSAGQRLAQIEREKVPILLVANHCSWWDGFFLAQLQRQLVPRASLFTVMLESEIRKHSWLRRLGAVGVDPKNPVSVARAFNKLKQLSQELPGPVVIAYFPQGEIRPQVEAQLNFKSGVELLIQMLRPLKIIPVALGIEPLNSFKPYGYVVSGPPLFVDSESDVVSAKSLEDLVEGLLRNDRPRLLSRQLSLSPQP